MTEKKMSALTDEHCRHMEFIISEFSRLMDDKYRKGQKEHGGNLWETPPHMLIDWAIDEAIDQVVYLLTLKSQHARRELGIRNLIVAAEKRLDGSRAGRVLRNAIMGVLPGGEPEAKLRDEELYHAMKMARDIGDAVSVKGNLRSQDRRAIGSVAAEIEAILRTHLE